MNKKKIIQLLIDRQHTMITDLTKSMESYQEYADLDEDDTLDPEDFSQQTVAKESQLRLQQQLGRAQSDLALLEHFAANNFDNVQAGALIHTDSLWFLVGISLGGFDVDDINLHCISTGSPAFDVVINKKVNDNFTLGNTNYKILKIA